MFFEFYFEGSLQVGFAGDFLLYVVRFDMDGPGLFLDWLVSRFVMYDCRFILRACVYLVEEPTIVLREGCVLVVGGDDAGRVSVFLYLFQRVLDIVSIDGGLFNFLPRLVGAGVVVPTRRDVVFVRVGLRSIAFFGFVNVLVLFVFK